MTDAARGHADAFSETPISLYFDLEPGQIADLAVVARAALAWTEALKEAAYFFDPSIEIKVEIESGTPGSLNINSRIKVLKEKLDNPVTLGSLVIVMMLWFGGHVAEKAFDHYWDQIVGADPMPVELSQKQIDEIANKVADAIAGRVAHPEVQRVYRELERDPVIKGIGVGPGHDRRPAVIVPRDEFPVRAGRSESLEYASPVTRNVSARMWVGLIRPVLLAHERRSWTFRAPTGDFSAEMKATAAMDRLITGQTPIPMVAGIEMEIELEVRQELVDGVWVIKHRSVTQIYDWRFPPTTGELFPAAH